MEEFKKLELNAGEAQNPVPETEPDWDGKQEKDIVEVIKRLKREKAEEEKQYKRKKPRKGQGGK